VIWGAAVFGMSDVPWENKNHYNVHSPGRQRMRLFSAGQFLLK
jgi:hypothetical protein